jgi:methanogenic corrinoid protein MtbC1
MASKGTGVLSASSEALRKAIVDPLFGRKPEAGANQPDKAPLADDSINAIIEGEIIPRLMMAHATALEVEGKHESEIAPSDARRFADLPLKLEASSLLAEVDSFIEQGVSLNSIFIDLLAPAARTLGEMWEQDDCDFVDVTMGLWRLQEVMREIAERAPKVEQDESLGPRAALFAPIPGDQHNFGALMIEEVFARAGWQSEVLLATQRRELLDILAKKPFDLVGLTVSRDCPSAALSSLVKSIRSVSANPHIAVLLGGQAINQNPAIVADVGADGTGADARTALLVAERLVQSAPVRASSMR